MKKSVKERIEAAKHRSTLLDVEVHNSEVKSQQVAHELHDSTGPISGVMKKVGAPGKKFPIKESSVPGVSKSDIATAEVAIGLQMRNKGKGTLPLVAKKIVQQRLFHWTAQSERAAVLLAEGLTPPYVANKLKISLSVMEMWLLDNEFKLRIRKHLEDLSEHVLKSGLANKTHRLIEENHRWEAAKRIVDERGQHFSKDELLKEIPGGSTGWLNKNLEYDATLAREMRELEKHAAIEMGQWSENSAPVTKIEISYADKQLIVNQAPVMPRQEIAKEVIEEQS